MVRPIRRISRGRRLSPEEAAKYRSIRAQFEAEKPAITARIQLQLEELSVLEQIVAQLRRARADRGLSLTDMQQLTGMERSALSKLETGRRPNCTVETLSRYAQAVGKRLVISLVDAGKS